MADDYDGDDGYFEMDDDWLYVEDEFNIADELAEGQIPDPGYIGASYEIAMESYEYDFFGYWDDLEYIDDAYWDYGLPNTEGEGGQKRKRGTEPGSGLGKRKSKRTKQTVVNIEGPEAEPLLYRSRVERNRSLKREAPTVDDKAFALLPDWRTRFADSDGAIHDKRMPEAMKRAAEAVHTETPLGTSQASNLALDVAVEGNEEEGDWEDEAEDGEGNLSIDPEMLKTILRERLGSGGMEGMDEDAFMETIRKMMSGDGDDDAAGELANALLGKVASDGGDEAVAGWLSQQGVSLEEEDDASSVATAELPQVPRKPATGHNGSPPDSAVSVLGNDDSRKSTQAPRHAGSPTATPKKRPANNDHASRKRKQVKFDVPSSTSKPTLSTPIEDEDDSACPSSDDPLALEATVHKSTPAKIKTRGRADPKSDPAASSHHVKKEGPRTRKRKAPSEDETAQAALAPNKKKTTARSPREPERLNAPDVAGVPSLAPPAKRTRSARAKGGR